ncbi:helix-turn-helix transcriptional regulator [Arthrobacter sp. 1P04PC]|uniref:helix-turn-helix domain-containing protein n=1 Tax=unclassified Arthrobacter TaxID=235627 RepID=UPI0039A006CE
MNTTTRHVNNAADADVADRIMHAMIVKGITRKALAENTGLSYSKLRRSLEQHRDDARSFTVEELRKVAGALNVAPSTILPADFMAAAV